MAGSVVPEELYLYWHQGWRNAPDIVKRCAETWTTHNPSWAVNLLDKDNIEGIIAIPSIVKALNLPLPALSDVIRSILLKQRGGVWADATLWCARPLDDWLEPSCRTAGFFGYDRPAADRPIATWFLAAATDSRIASLWHAAVLRLATKTKYCLHLKASGLPCEGLFSWIMPQLKGLSMPTSDQPEDNNYFWIHELFQLCLDSDAEFRELWLSVPKISADGPHILQRFGLLNPANTDALAHIGNMKANVYKLTRREVIPSDISGTILDALYRSHPVSARRQAVQQAHGPAQAFHWRQEGA